MTPPRTTATYALAGMSIAVRAEDRAAAAAFDLRLGAHPGPSAAAPDLVIDVVVGRERLERPEGAGRSVYAMSAGELQYFPDADELYADLGTVRMRCAPSAGVARIACDRYAGRALYLASHPLATLVLIELLKRRRRFNLHAGCVARRQGGEASGVVLCGTSGAGKSTLTLALARAGLDVLADDMVFLEAAGASVQAHAFHDAVAVTPLTARLLPQVGGLLERPPADGFPKHLLGLDRLGAGTTARCKPVAAVFPTVAAQQRSALEPLDGREAWLRLVPDVLLTHPASTQAHLAALAGLLAQVRCYRVRSGSDLDRAADLVAGVLED